jgi:hypothetical protein
MSVQVVEGRVDILGSDGHFSWLDGGQNDVSAAGNASDIQDERTGVSDVGIVVERRF